MNINIEEYNSVAAFLSGLYKFEEDGLFFQAMLGVTDKALLVYNDHAPDSKTADVLVYKVKERIPFEKINSIFNEQIINNKDLSGLGRINIFFSKEEGGKYFYYFLEDKKALKFFLDVLKNSGFRVKKGKVDLAKD